jgi:hypothetical protein
MNNRLFWVLVVGGVALAGGVAAGFLFGGHGDGVAHTSHAVVPIVAVFGAVIALATSRRRAAANKASADTNAKEG